MIGDTHTADITDAWNECVDPENAFGDIATATFREDETMYSDECHGDLSGPKLTLVSIAVEGDDGDYNFSRSRCFLFLPIETIWRLEEVATEALLDEAVV